ncbi:uncharacterized protein KIAA0930 homolog [Paramacrobiotus metropolitanus]|uniref:uncharacterized protein KIAA0930 homolog n=1 Tax=Paramacrobiotus metropolitanus TaxID=2943436 RepID=UPI00244654DD|nr:uncharacterized protein KIAA0930 homolog [Paramacrobiotus metropolitanus]
MAASNYTRRKIDQRRSLQPERENWDDDSASDRGISFAARGSPSPAFPQSGLIHRLFPFIIEERSKNRHKQRTETWAYGSAFMDPGLHVSPYPAQTNDSKWADMFFDNFVPSINHQNHELQDDLLFLVRRAVPEDSKTGIPQVSVDVIRRENIAKLPAPNDRTVEWEETVYLNLILNHLEYLVTCAVCSRSTPKDLQIIRRQTTRVFASPSKRRMDSKGESEEMAYPNLFFCIDNFEEIFSEIVVRDGEMVCVELVAKDPMGSSIKSVLFLGSVRYELLKQVFDARASLTSKMAERMSLWNMNRRTEFVRMKGPQGRGYAEMAVSKVQGSKPSTPCHDEADEFDFGDVEEQLQMNSRRQSDPFRQIGVPLRSTNQPNFLRKSHSESFRSEFDSRLSNEVQATPLQDEVEEGGFYNQWGFRGLNQAWHWYKERRRNGSIALNGHLTYVTLPWSAIINAVLEEKSQPVLTDI